MWSAQRVGGVPVRICSLIHGRTSTISRLGAGAFEALPALIEALSDGYLTARAWAVIALERLGTDARPAVPGLLGLVADHLRTDTKHARALDAVLGTRANALVASSRETAQLVLGWLKKREAGQVGLVLPGGVGPIAPRGFPAVLTKGDPKFQHGSGRQELADRIFSDAGPLSARVIVNRVWAWHFGKPLVATPRVLS